jgi:uncharacterized tellurite resistance protein B-like protein
MMRLFYRGGKMVKIELEDKIKGTMKNAINKTKETVQRHGTEKKNGNDNVSEVTAISPENALKIFYYLIAIDGKITKEEEEKFNLIGQEIDNNYIEHSDSIIKCCKEQLEKVIDDADFYDVVQDGVMDALITNQLLENGYITPKLLLWDMITLAYEDGEYADIERRLIKFVVRKLNISKDIYLEMENSYLTISDIEKESEWVKNTDRPYRTIEAHVKELEKRRNDIFENIKAIIYL